MGFAGKPVGPQGLALLAVTAVAGVILGVHGWSDRHAGVAPGSLAGAASAPSVSASPSPSSGPIGPTVAPSPSGSGATPGPTASATSGPGPLLSSQSYASYSFLVWPGTPSAAARTAMTGLSVSVRRQGSGISVTAGVTGQTGTSAHYYPTGARVYIIEASLGDDSGNSDYSLGDDGLIVTDARGRIVQ